MAKNKTFIKICTNNFDAIYNTFRDVFIFLLFSDNLTYIAHLNLRTGHRLFDVPNLFTSKTNICISLEMVLSAYPYCFDDLGI